MSAARAGRASGRVSLLLLGAVLVASIPLYRHGLVPLDEGAMVHVAERLSHGEVLYRDVATGVAPGAYYLLAMVFLLFGPNLAAGRLLAAALLGAGTVLVHRIALRAVPSRVAPWPAAAFGAVGLYHFRYPSYSALAVVLYLAATWLMLRHLESGRVRDLIAAGVAVGLCCLTKQNYGLFASCALAAAVVVAGRDAGWRPRLRSLALLGAGAAAPVLLALAFFTATAAVGPMVDYGFRKVVTGTGHAFYKPYPLLDPRRPLAFLDDLPNYAPFPPATELLPRGSLRRIWPALVLVAYLGLPAVLLASVWSLVSALVKRRAEPWQAAVVPTALLLSLGVLPRADLIHLVMVAPLALVLAARIAAGLGSSWVRGGAAALAAAAILLSVVPPWAEVLQRGPSAPSEPLALERARGVLAKPAEARTLRTTVEYVASHTAKGEPILSVPADPLVYFLARRANASPYPLVLPGAFELDPFLAALDSVETVVLRDVAYDQLPLFEIMPEVYARLRADFEPDPAFLDRLDRPELQPLVVLRRRTAGVASKPPAAWAGAPLRGTATLEAWAAREPVILNTLERVHRSRRREERRVEVAEWLLEPAVRLRPPSGWQKLAVAWRVQLPPGAVLRFGYGQRPPQAAGDRPPDGAGLELWVWRHASRALERRFHTTLAPTDWRWHGAKLSLADLAGADVVLVFAATPGAGLDETEDEVLVARPLLEEDGRPIDEAQGESVDVAGLPKTVLDGIARYDDPAPFVAALAEPGLADDRRALLERQLGQVLAATGSPGDGLAHVERALAIDPTDRETILAAAELETVLGEAERAEQHYAVLLGTDPENRRALIMSARLALDGARLDEALRLVRRARAVGDGDGEARFLQAVIELASWHGDEASVTLLELLADTPAPRVRTDALRLLGRTLPGDSVSVGDHTLTRLREPLDPRAFAAALEPLELPMRRLFPSQPIGFDFEVRNRSPLPWPALGEEDGAHHRLAVGFRWRRETTGEEDDAGRLPLPHDLAPGESATLRFEGAAPNRPGRYVLVLDLLQEGVAWFAQRGGRPIEVPFTVTAPAGAAAATTDATSKGTSQADVHDDEAHG